MIKRIVILPIILTQLILLTGCWDINELKNLLYFNAVGIDYVDGKYVVYAQAVDPAFISKTEGGKPTEEAQVWVGRSEADTLYQAFFNFYPTSQKKVYYGHITAIILSENVLKSDVQNVIDIWERYYELRENIWIYSSKQKIEDILSTNSLFGQSALNTILHEPMANYSQNSFLQPLYFFRFVSDYTEKGKTVIIPTITVEKNDWEVNKKEKPILRIDGADVFQGEKYKGSFSLDQLKGKRWVNEETIRTLLNVKKENEDIVALVVTKPKVKIKSKLQDGKPKFSIEIKLNARINQILKNVSTDEIVQLATEQIKQEILDTYKEGLKKQVDILQLGYELFRSAPKAWYLAFGSDHHQFPLDENSITDVIIKIHISNTGNLKKREVFDQHQR